MGLSATELRIGNFVNTSERSGASYQMCRQGGIKTINNGSCNIAPLNCISPIVTVNLKNIDPIPLTEEWLLKFGFRKYSSVQWYREDFWNIEFKRYGCYWCNQLQIHIQYVHQLQNLYFALTGEELTINNEL